jgi:exo-beta-1,3-glucanase (GH17 family)
MAAVAGLAAVLVATVVRAEAVCARGDAAHGALLRLEAAMGEGRFVGYGPTALRIVDGHATHADPASIRADLAVLRPRFDSLVTYSALHGAEAIPGIAAELGFRALVIGIWNPFDSAEVDAALDAAQRYPRLIVGLSVGNELVFAHRRTAAELASRIAGIRLRAPGVPLAATEPFHVFYEPSDRPVLERVDFLLPNVHPVFQSWFATAPDANAARFVVGVVDELAHRFCGPILVKETGVPTAPAAKGFTEQRQASFYRELRGAFVPSRSRAFVYFAAFDAPWRVADEQAAPGFHPEEAHWGLFTDSRAPKAAARELPPLVASPP